MRVTVQTDDDKPATMARTGKPVHIDTIASGKVTVGIFDNDIQVINVTGDRDKTMIKFNGKSLL